MLELDLNQYVGKDKIVSTPIFEVNGTAYTCISRRFETSEEVKEILKNENVRAYKLFEYSEGSCGQISSYYILRYADIGDGVGVPRYLDGTEIITGDIITTKCCPTTELCIGKFTDSVINEHGFILTYLKGNTHQFFGTIKLVDILTHRRANVESETIERLYNNIPIQFTTENLLDKNGRSTGDKKIKATTKFDSQTVISGLIPYWENDKTKIFEHTKESLKIHHIKKIKESVGLTYACLEALHKLILIATYNVSPAQMDELKQCDKIITDNLFRNY